MYRTGGIAIPIKRTYIFMTAVLLLLGLLLATAVMAQEGNDDEPVDLDEIQEDVVRELYDENGRMFDTDQRLAGIAREYGGGSAVTTSPIPTRARFTSTC